MISTHKAPEKVVLNLKCLSIPLNVQDLQYETVQQAKLHFGNNYIDMFYLSNQEFWALRNAVNLLCVWVCSEQI